MIGFVVFGLVVGVAARALVPGRQQMSIRFTLGLGVAGSVAGGIIANALGTGDIWELDFIGSVVAVASAAALVVGAERTGLGRPDGKQSSRRR